MDCALTGNLICRLRKEHGLTQKQLADILNVSDKAISKWERGLGCPDVSLLPALALALSVNIDGLLAGKLEVNQTVGGNMKKISFYVCPRCLNMLTATGDASISCCGKRLSSLPFAKADDEHQLLLETVEDEVFITSSHPMTKDHYIAFIALVKDDRLFLVKQYPEWNLQLRLPRLGRSLLYFYCLQHGLFCQRI